MSTIPTAFEELREELALKRAFVSEEEAALLSFLATGQKINRLAYVFFARYGLSDAQFNVLILLGDLPDRKVHQWELADMLLVNRASMGSLIDRMLRKGLVQRIEDPDDRRAFCVSLTAKGSKLSQKVKKPYYTLLKDAFRTFSADDKEKFTGHLNLLRKGIGGLNLSRQAFARKNV